MKTISFVIAVYRNEASLRPTYEELKGLFAQGAPLSAYAPEFVFVDDGSDDGALGVLTALHEADPSVKVISFSRNFGQIAAVVAGFRHAKGDAILNKAADMQEPKEAIVEMVRAWERGALVVIGNRSGREDSFLANVLGNAYWRILRGLNPNLPTGSDFFLLGRQSAEIFNAIEESDRFFPVDVLWLGFRPVVVPYHRQKRHSGRSQWSLSRKVKLGLDGILHSSYLPIRLMSLVGFVVAGLGFLAAVVLATMRLVQGTTVPIWWSVVCLLLFLHGLTFLMLGVIGEYLWRAFNQAKGRPEYIIRQKLE